MDYIIDEMTFTDWGQVSRIYLEGIQTGKATFQTTAPSWEDWNKGHLKYIASLSYLKYYMSINEYKHIIDMLKRREVIRWI